MQEIIENAEPMEIREQPTTSKEQPTQSPPESPQLPENQPPSQDVSPVRTPSPSHGTPPEAKKLRTSSQKERLITAGNWNGERRGGNRSTSPSSSPTKTSIRDNLNSKYESQMKPLQRLDKMSSNPDVEYHKGYHSYAVRTSPVNPPLENEAKAFPPPQAGTPDLKEEPKDVLPSQKVQEKKTAAESDKKVKPEEVKDVKVEKPSEAKTETKIVQKAEPKTVLKTEPKVVQKPAPPKAEPKVVAKPAPQKPEPKAAPKTESKALAKFDTKSLVKKGAQAAPAAKAEEEVEEVGIMMTALGSLNPKWIPQFTIDRTINNSPTLYAS